MTDRFILVVSDEDEGSHGKVAILDSAREAERCVQSLLEAGFDLKRIQVFAGGPASVAITYQPTVLLMEGDSVEGRGSAARSNDQAEPELVPVGAQLDRPPLAANNGDSSTLVEDQVPSVSRSRTEEVRHEAMPVPAVVNSYDDRPAIQGHFSDLFRPAYVD